MIRLILFSLVLLVLAGALIWKLNMTEADQIFVRRVLYFLLALFLSILFVFFISIHEVKAIFEFLKNLF